MAICLVFFEGKLSILILLSGAVIMSVGSLITHSLGFYKEAGKDWINYFINFIAFLCGLTLELAQGLRNLCEEENYSKVLKSVDRLHLKLKKK